MYRSLLRYLRCPECAGVLDLASLVSEVTDGSDEIMYGLLRCAAGHLFPVAGGIPRMLPDSMAQHWGALKAHLPSPLPEEVRSWIGALSDASDYIEYDRRTRENFSLEWSNFDLGGRTWGMDLQQRIEWFFLDPIRLAQTELTGKVVLDAGCGNGSQSVAYSEWGVEVLAIDLSDGLEHGHRFRHLHPGASPAKVHFIQGDLQRPPIAPASMDIVHSAGVLHHTPDTRVSFGRLRPLLRPGGTFYVWLYKHEDGVTPLVDSIRTLTTSLPPVFFARVARVMSSPFAWFCATLNALGVRAYSRMSRREAALALMDIFGAPYAHSHSFEEVSEWYQAEGFTELWKCNETRRGFGVCGRLPFTELQPEEIAIQERPNHEGAAVA